MCSPVHTERYDKQLAHPLGLSGHRLVSDWQDNGFYVIGGWTMEIDSDDPEESSDSHYCRQIWKYNFSSKKWKQLKCDNPPISLASHTLCKLDSETLGLLMYGGSLSSRGILGNSNEVYLYNVNTETWQPLKTTGTPCPVECDHWFGQAMQRCGDDLFVTTGINNDGLKVHKLNLHKLIWEDLGSSIAKQHQPDARIRHEMFVYDNKVFVVGGGRDLQDRSFSLNKLPCFDISSQKWIDLDTVPNDDFPLARQCHGLVASGDNVYVTGGLNCTIDEDSYEHNQTPLSDIWRFHVPSLTWKKLPFNLPTPLWFHAMDANSDGQLITYGGLTTDSYYIDRTTDIYTINVDKVDRLESLCWNSVVDKVKCLDSFSDDILMDAGISGKFLSKIRW